MPIYTYPFDPDQYHEQGEQVSMEIEARPVGQPPTRRGGRPAGSKGNGKSLPERLNRIKAREQVAHAEMEEERSVTRARLELDAQKAEALIQTRIAEQKQLLAKRVLDQVQKQEDRRSPQFQIDQRGTLILLIILAAVMFITTAVLTADGTIGSSGAAKFVSPVMGFILFGAFEVGILVFMLLYYVRGSRTHPVTGKRVSSLHWFWAMVAVSMLTVGLSAYHVLDLYDYDFSSIDVYVGIGIRLAVSVLFVLVSKGIAGVLFAKSLSVSDLQKVGVANG